MTTNTMMRRVTLWLFTLGLCLSAMACGKTQLSEAPPAPDWSLEAPAPDWEIPEPGGIPDGPRQLVGLLVEPADVVLTRNGRQIIGVKAAYSDDTTEDVTGEATLESSDERVVSIDGDAIVAENPGRAQVVATWSGESATVEVEVEDVRVVDVTITPLTAEVRPGGALAMRAEGQLSDGRREDITAQVSWSTLDERVGTVSNQPGEQGRVTGVAEGRTIIEASANGVTGRADLTVREVVELSALSLSPPIADLLTGSTRRFEVFGLYTNGSLSELSRAATWSIEGDPQVATVADAGLLEAVAPGSVELVARYGAFEVRAPITVRPERAVALAMYPPSITLGVYGQAQLSVDATLDDGSRRDVTREASWTTTDASIVSVDQSGEVIARAPGTAEVVATIQGVEARSRVLVTNASLRDVTVEPFEAVLGVGIERQLRAIARYNDGTSAEVTRAASWSLSSRGALDLFDDDRPGRVRALAAGAAVARAELAGFTGLASLTVTDAELVRVEVTPSEVWMGEGQSQQFRAQAFWADGANADVTGSATWTSDSDAVRVDTGDWARGRATAARLGGATITAQVGLVRGEAIVTVTDERPDELTISPPVLTLPVATSLPLEATATYPPERERRVTEQASWTSSNPLIATVQNTPGFEGRVRALQPGNVTITASYLGREATMELTVSSATLTEILITPEDAALPVGSTNQYSATGIFSDGTSVYITREATWGVDDTQIARAFNGPGAEGEVQTIGPGTTRVTASYMGQLGEATLDVVGAALNRVEVLPDTSVIAVGGKRQLAAFAVFEDGSRRNVSAWAQWSTTDPVAASVDTYGVVSTLTPGVVDVLATWGGQTGSSTLEITDASLVEIQVSPRRVEVPIDNYVRFFATAIFSDGTREDVSEEAQWKSDDPRIMSVAGGRWIPGVALGQGAGSTTITAQWGGLVGEAEGIVTEAELLEVRISPFNLELQPGVEFQFLATAIFSDGTSRDVTFLSKWISPDRGVVDVLDDWRQKGKAFSVREGTVEVTATYREVMGRATITVTPATITQIQVIPFDPTVNVGDEIRFFATALYSDGTSRQVWRDALWQTTDPDIATVSNARWYEGVTTAHAPGTARILATYNGVTGEAELTVQGKRIDRIQVTPFIEEIPTGYYLQLFATAIYDDGTARDVTGAATWTSSAPSVADVYTSFWIKGVVLGSAPGSTFVEATYQGVSGRMNLTVTDATLQAIRLDPPAATVPAGDQQEFEATGIFTDGTEREVTWYVTWSSTDTNVADVSNAWITRGEATGFTQGTTRIQASQGSVVGEATLDVLP